MIVKVVTALFLFLLPITIGGQNHKHHKRKTGMTNRRAEKVEPLLLPEEKKRLAENKATLKAITDSVPRLEKELAAVKSSKAELEKAVAGMAGTLAKSEREKILAKREKHRIIWLTVLGWLVLGIVMWLMRYPNPAQKHEEVVGQKDSLLTPVAQNPENGFANSESASSVSLSGNEDFAIRDAPQEPRCV